MRKRTVLVTGATGYIGGRLVPALVDRGYHVRCLVRHPEKARGRFDERVEIVGGDLLQPSSLSAEQFDAGTAYYLVHALASSGDLSEEETAAATNFVRSALEGGVERIIYLGALGSGSTSSPHLATRHDVGRILRDSGIPTIELRASIVLGSGSLSFEMIRALVERLPIMITPRWVSRQAQPIAIEDVISYLVAALEVPLATSEVVEIGGADRASYRDMLLEYARQRGLRRAIIPVKVLTPRLSSLWLKLITPLHARAGRRLIESVREDTIVRSTRAHELFRDVKPRGMRAAFQRALANEDREFVETHWSDPASSRGRSQSWHGVRFGMRRVDSRAIDVSVSARQAFAPIARIGGTTGWYYANALWRLRGFADLLLGGVGVRRGRRHPERLLPGDALDFWRVEEMIPDQLLRLHAEMKLPGRAWLQFEVSGESPVVIRQTATFDPIGLFGLLYWYALYPVHALMFAGMLRAIARSAEEKPKEARTRVR
jgi:uncharacterized protein YbjT (DUF2867 family)